MKSPVAVPRGDGAPPWFAHAARAGSRAHCRVGGAIACNVSNEASGQPTAARALVGRNAGEKGRQRQFFAAGQGLEDAEIRHHGLRARAAGAAASALAIACRGSRRWCRNRASSRSCAARLSSRRRSAWHAMAISGAPPGAGQARRGFFVRADDGAVEIAEAVDLRRAQKADVHAPALQVVGEYLRQRHDAGRGLASSPSPMDRGRTLGRVPMVPDS